MNTVLKAYNISKIYGSKDVYYPALSGLNLEIKQGEFIGIMGPSGSGKTTLLNLLATIDKPTSGKIEFEGKSTDSMSQLQISEFRRDKLGFIFQDFNLLDTLTVEENVALPLALAGVKSSLINTRVHNACKTLGIETLMQKRPYEISGGQKQRVTTARAIVTNPTLILADEPTGNLDSKSARELLQSFSALNENYKSTILMVTHDAFSASWCKRIVFLKDGKIFGEIIAGADRKVFFDRIIESLKTLEGGER